MPWHKQVLVIVILNLDFTCPVKSTSEGMPVAEVEQSYFTG